MARRPDLPGSPGLISPELFDFVREHYVKK